jgi:hypothetical protein
MAAGYPEYVGNQVADPVIGLTEDRHVSIIPNYPSWRNRPGVPGLDMPGFLRAAAGQPDEQEEAPERVTFPQSV